MIDGSWDKRCERQFFVIFGHFLPSNTPNNPKYQNFEKTKKKSEDIILHLCITNDNHIMYGCWYMEHEKNTWRYHNFTVVYQKWQSYDVWFLRYGVLQRFLSFWTIFCPFNPLTTQKIKILKTMKKHPGDIIILHVYHKWKSYHVWFLRYGAWQTYFFVILGHFLLFYPTKSKFWKNERTPSFYTSVPKITIICFTVSVI